jgi:cyanophycinase
MNVSTLALVSILLAQATTTTTTSGPATGSLVIGGGNDVPAIVKAFVELAGGPEAKIVFIPTAIENDEGLERSFRAWKNRFGVKNATMLHTRDRKEADSDAFVAPLIEARGVWFGGGRQWRLVDSYMGTRTQKELEKVLQRGGVIGGSSAGATIQGSYLVRGAREGNHIMMAKGYEEGFGYVKNAAFDQHLITRHREEDLVPVIEAHPELLGIGLDEPAAVVVKGDVLEVIGRSKVAIYDGKDHDGKKYYFLEVGDRFDLKTRTAIKK